MELLHNDASYLRTKKVATPYSVPAFIDNPTFRGRKLTLQPYAHNSTHARLNAYGLTIMY